LSNQVNIATTINVVEFNSTTNTINIVPTQTSINIVDGVGTPGDGVAGGGNTDDILVKKSNLSYDTEWTDDITVDSITYDTNAGIEPDDLGETAWSLDNRTIAINKGNGVVQYVSQDLSYPVCRNAEATSLQRGELVMVDPAQAAQGQRLRVKRYVSNGTLPADLFVGMVIEAIAPNQTGFVKWFGQVLNLSLPLLQPVGETWAEGDILWPNPAIAGGMTRFEPVAPAHKITVAAILRITGNNINMLVRPNLRTKIVDLHDVQVTNVQTNQVLSWDGSIWRNADAATQGVETVTGDGVDNTDPQNPVLSWPTPDDIGAYSNTNPDGFVDAAGAANAAPVQSVNGQTNVVTLDADDVGAYSNTNPSGYVDASGAAAAAPIQSVTGDGVDNSNVGNIVISYPTVDDIGAYSNTNPDGYVDASGAAAAAPVQSVNGQTNVVVLNVADLNDANISNPQVDEVLKYDGTAWVNGIGGAPELQRRHSFEQPYSYCGFADDGEAESANVWQITRINVALDGTATTGQATNVNWTNRSTHSYT
jgi:hypothetical protein